MFDKGRADVHSVDRSGCDEPQSPLTVSQYAAFVRGGFRFWSGNDPEAQNVAVQRYPSTPRLDAGARSSAYSFGSTSINRRQQKHIERCNARAKSNGVDVRNNPVTGG